MKKLILAFLLLQFTLYAQSILISSIPIPKTYIQNLEPYECDEDCLEEYLEEDKIFSFLSHVNSKLENQTLDDARLMNVSILNLGSSVVTDKIKIALLLPYKIIGKYASSTTNASFAYLIAKNRSFELKTYKIDTENKEDLEKALIDIKHDGFYYVIAPLTKAGANTVSQIDPRLNIYFPTINKKEINSESAYLFFGGIDYQAQNDMLLQQSVSPLVIFYDESSIGNNLAYYQEKKFNEMDIVDTNYTGEIDGNFSIETYYNDIDNDDFYFDENSTQLSGDNFIRYLTKEEKKIIKFSIPKRTTNLEKQLKNNQDILRGSFVLNTPIVKSGMIMSQLTLYDTNATNILSTQINYDPLLLSMTQYRDRKQMLIANSITSTNNVLVETNSLLDNDIVYDWINYTTTVGIDYFFNLVTQESREYSINMVDNQMLYPIEILKPSKSRFIDYHKVIEENSL